MSTLVSGFIYVGSLLEKNTFLPGTTFVAYEDQILGHYPCLAEAVFDLWQKQPCLHKAIPFENLGNVVFLHVVERANYDSTLLRRVPGGNLRFQGGHRFSLGCSCVEYGGFLTNDPSRSCSNFRCDGMMRWYPTPEFGQDQWECSTCTSLEVTSSEETQILRDARRHFFLRGQRRLSPIRGRN